MTTVSAYSYTHSTTYVADNILKSFKDIIRLSGLDPTKFVDNWELHRRGIKEWLDSGHLTRVILEIFHPRTDALIIRWDIDIAYEWSSGDGSFYTDTDQLRYAIRKAGIAPSEAKYDMLLRVKPGHPAVMGWNDGTGRSTDGFSRHALGTTIEHSGLGASAAYWRRA
jgi:hypothetical protein